MGGMSKKFTSELRMKITEDGEPDRDLGVGTDGEWITIEGRGRFGGFQEIVLTQAQALDLVGMIDTARHVTLPKEAR